MHSLEIIERQFEKERHTLLCILKLFTNIVHELSLKNAWLPPIFFWISITLVKIYLSCIISNPGKNTLELVGTVLKEIFFKIIFGHCSFLCIKVNILF